MHREGIGENFRCAQNERMILVLVYLKGPTFLACQKSPGIDNTDSHILNEVKTSEIKAMKAWHYPRPKRLRLATPPAGRSSVRSCC